jgi:hypothetical protein
MSRWSGSGPERSLKPRVSASRKKKPKLLEIVVSCKVNSSRSGIPALGRHSGVNPMDSFAQVIDANDCTCGTRSCANAAAGTAHMGMGSGDRPGRGLVGSGGPGGGKTSGRGSGSGSGSGLGPGWGLGMGGMTGPGRRSSSISGGILSGMQETEVTLFRQAPLCSLPTKGASNSQLCSVSPNLRTELQCWSISFSG